MSNSVHHSPGCCIASNSSVSVIPISTLKCATNSNSNRNWAFHHRFIRTVAKSNSDAQTQAKATQPSTTTPTSFLSFLCPLLNLLSVSATLSLSPLIIMHTLCSLNDYYLIWCFWQGGDPSRQRNFALEVRPFSLSHIFPFSFSQLPLIPSYIFKLTSVCLYIISPKIFTC